MTSSHALDRWTEGREIVVTWEELTQLTKCRGTDSWAAKLSVIAHRIGIGHEVDAELAVHRMPRFVPGNPGSR